MRDNFDWRDLRGLGKLLAWMCLQSDSTRKEHEMETSPRVSPQQFAESMKDEIEQFAKDVMEAVNNAPDGAVDRRQRRTGARPFGGDAPQGF